MRSQRFRVLTECEFSPEVVGFRTLRGFVGRKFYSGVFLISVSVGAAMNAEEIVCEILAARPEVTRQ